MPLTSVSSPHARELLFGCVLPSAPIAIVVEAKSDEAFGEGLGQTLGEMLAARTSADQCAVLAV